MHPALHATDHRPYPLPTQPWALQMTWRDLLFMHWPVPAAALRPLIPKMLELDTFDGSAWLGVVPFNMRNVHPRYTFSVPGVSNFPELNLRTYVSAGGKAGVWFFSLEAGNPVAVRVARTGFHLPYFNAAMGCADIGGTVYYQSKRTHRNAPAAEFVAAYRPVGKVNLSPNTLERFLTERYCLYSADAKGRVYRGEIHHQRWPLQRAEAEVQVNRMTGQIGVTLPDTEPLLHFSKALEVVAWLPRAL